MYPKHVNLRVSLCGLFINPQFPILGASPDGIVECECCGVGVLEIKCPYCVRDCTEETEFLEKVNYLKSVTNEKENYGLDKDHSFFYQIQCQLFVADKEYCDFMVWNKAVHFIQRFYQDDAFWQKNYPLAVEYFHGIVMPELLGKFWTRSSRSKVNIYSQYL